MIVLVGGGSRSGKSRFALEQARLRGRPLAFVATAEARDEEMRLRAAAHRRERGDEFETFEEPLDIARAIEAAVPRCHAVVVDCLTLWLANLMSTEPARDIARETMSLLRTASECDAAVVLVTNEVGCGIVPENELARRFRDLAGTMNQQAALAAAEVYWMAFGCPVRLK